MFLDSIIKVQSRDKSNIERLRSEGLPLVIYGAGECALGVTDFLLKNDIPVAGYFVDDEFLNSPKNLITNVSSLLDIKQKLGKFNIVNAIYSNITASCKRLSMLKDNQIAGVYFFECPFYNSYLDFKHEYVERHIDKYNKVYDLLSDDRSKETFIRFINTKISGDNGFLLDVYSNDLYFPEELISFSDNEIVVDGGAYDGDTLLSFIDKAGKKYTRYYAFEPDNTNVSKLKELIWKNDITNIRIIEKGLWSKADILQFSSDNTMFSTITEEGDTRIEVDSIDNAAPDATYIKMDIEGSELEALKGGMQTIMRNHPKLAISVYHKPEDLFEIPLYLNSIMPEYKLYLRAHKLNSCDLVLYAI